MRLIISIFLIIFSFAVKGQEIISDSQYAYQNIGKRVAYLEDKQATKSLKQIISLDSLGKFKKGEQDILNFGNTTSAIWIKIKYINYPSSPLYLVLSSANIDNVDIYMEKADQSFKHLKTGNAFYPVPGVDIENNFIFKLPQEANQKYKSVYMRLKTNNILVVPLKLVTGEVLFKGKAFTDRIEYIYIGILISLLLYNLFLYISLQDRTYLYYTLHVLTLSCYLMVYLRGYGFLFGNDMRILMNQYPHVFLSLSMISSFFFSRSFLNLEKIAPRMLNVYYFLGGCAVVLLILSLSGNKRYCASIAQVLTASVSLSLWVSGILAYRRGHQPAKYYVAGFFFVLLSVGLVTFSLAGILRFNDFTMELVPIGSTVELLLLSFALGDRYRIIMKKERDTSYQNLALVQNQKVQLEELVQKRTLLLTKTIAELKSSNNVKNKLFSIIAHDLRSPLNSLMSILALNDSDILSMDDIQFLLKENKKNIETIYNTLNNLLYWAKSQMDGIKTEATHFELKQLIEELLLVYAPLLHNKQIQVVLEFDGLFPVYADENQVKLIIRNLIDNAIKFTPKRGKVWLSLKRRSTGVNVEISNSVADLKSIENLDAKQLHDFKATYGTENERGVGLGLHLCREYIKSNGGDLKINTERDIISFSFTLPR
ncbi:histidine kinase [Pedobacter sp. HMWF019]|nr:histidine kinase [Pedobacter sp. HMWF019]